MAKKSRGSTRRTNIRRKNTMKRKSMRRTNRKRTNRKRRSRKRRSRKAKNNNYLMRGGSTPAERSKQIYYANQPNGHATTLYSGRTDGIEPEWPPTDATHDIPRGQKLERLYENQWVQGPHTIVHWAKVKYGDLYGWVKAQNISSHPPGPAVELPPPEEKVMYSDEVQKIINTIKTPPHSGSGISEVWQNGLLALLEEGYYDSIMDILYNRNGEFASDTYGQCIWNRWFDVQINEFIKMHPEYDSLVDREALAKAHETRMAPVEPEPEPEPEPAGGMGAPPPMLDILQMTRESHGNALVDELIKQFGEEEARQKILGIVSKSRKAPAIAASAASADDDEDEFTL